MNYFTSLSFAAILIMNSGAGAQTSEVLTVDLKKKLSAPLDFYQVTENGKRKPLPKLAVLKKHQLDGEHESCAQEASKSFQSEKLIQGWVALTWLQCVDNVRDTRKRESLRDQAVKDLEKFARETSSALWSKDLRDLWLTLRLQSLEQQTQGKANAQVTAGLGRLLVDSWNLDRGQTAKVYELLGEQAYLNKDTDQARFFFQQAKAFGGSSRVTDRLRLLNSDAVTAPSARTGEEGVEQQMEKRIQQNQQQKNYSAALDDLLTLLREYPGSKVTSRNQSKPIEIYNSVPSDQQEKILKQISAAPGFALAEWTKQLHRRSDFKGSLVLAKATFSQSDEFLRDTQLLWIAGRSAHMLGDYSVALHYFERLMSSHAGTTEAAEAQFRSGLIYLRQGEFASASALLEKLVNQNLDRYNLTARYWNARALEAAKSENFNKAARELIDLYPWTYYGLRLSAELNKNSLAWPTPAKSTATDASKKIYLVGEAKQSWNRFRRLSELGWLNEAHQELKNLPGALEPQTQVFLAELLQEQLQYFQVIRLINSAQDESPASVGENEIRWAYPLVFETYYKNEEKRTGVSAILLRSLSRQESGFYMKAVSTSKAMGLMQMIPPTAQEIADQMGLKIQLPDTLFRPETNISMGSFYVAKMLNQFQKNVPFALAAYNAGPQRMKNWISLRGELQKNLESAGSDPLEEIWYDELPWSETSFYVKAILRNVFLYRLVDKSPVSLKGPIWADLQDKKTK